jgi:hypothetical protein
LYHACIVAKTQDEAPSTLVRAMPRCNNHFSRDTPLSNQLARRLAVFPLAVALLAGAASNANAQARYESPLHVATSRIEFVLSGDNQPLTKPLVVHNGGTAKLTDVRLVRLAYADSTRKGWLVSLQRQSSIAPDELATAGTLCVDASGLPAGTYHATAAVTAREVKEPTAIAIAVIVTESAARASKSAARCATSTSK